MRTDQTRILVILDPAAGEESTVRALLARDAAELYIIAPVLPTRLAWLTNDDGKAVASSERQLEGALKTACDAGLAAEGVVGSDDDLLTVIDDALAQFPADEIVLATRPDEKSHWRVETLVEQVRERHGKPLRTLALTSRESDSPRTRDTAP